MGYRKSTERSIANFFKKVNKDGPIQNHVPEIGKCWVWTGKVTKKKYI